LLLTLGDAWRRLETLGCQKFLNQEYETVWLTQREKSGIICWIINYNSKREDLEEEDQRQDERNVIL